MSPEVLENLSRTVGNMTKSRSALEVFGRQTVKTVRALDLLNKVVETTTLPSWTMQDFGAISRFSLNWNLTPRPSLIPHKHSLYRDIDTDVLAIIREQADPVVKLPHGAQWSYVVCHFIDGHTLSVSYNGKLIGKYDHDKLGFAMRNTRDGKPNKQWELLQLLALLDSYKSREHGKLTQPTVATIAEMFEVKVGVIYKRIQTLSHTLQDAFGINDNPFDEYNPELGYQLKFHLKPETLVRGKGSLFPSGSVLFEDKIGIDDEY